MSKNIKLHALIVCLISYCFYCIMLPIHLKEIHHFLTQELEILYFLL